MSRLGAAGVVLGAAALLLLLQIGWTQYGESTELNEIGEGERAYTEDDQNWVEHKYKLAQPFRDPGHISRQEIRLERALKEAGAISKSRPWSWQTPLWGNYHAANRDPSSATVGWTDAGEVSSDANHLQAAVEKYSYGREGHREPEQEWAPGEDRSDDISMTPEQKEAADRAVRNTWEYPAANELRKLRGDIHALLRTSKGTRAGNVRQQLTYKVLKDELVHARLKEQVAAAKAAENEQKEQMDEKALQDAQETEKEEVSELKSNMARLRRKLKRLAKEHKRHMSSSEAQKDLDSYFSTLSTQTAKNEVSRYQKKLAKLRKEEHLVESKGDSQELRQISLAREQRDSRSQQHKLKGGSSGLKTQRGVEQQLALASSKPAQKKEVHDDLQNLVDGLVRNSAPYLPGVPGI